MRRTGFFVLAFIGIVVLAAAKKNKDQEQVPPLPPEPPMALLADTASLDFHISPLLKSGGLAAQIKSSLSDLIRNTHGETIVKLRAFVAGTGDARRVQAAVADLFTDRKLPLPVLSILQVGALASPTAQVVIEATVSTPRTENPDGLAFVFGQTGRDFPSAVARLKETTRKAELPAENLTTVTCFASAPASFDAAQQTLREAFPKADVNVVQPLRDPASTFTSCEATAKLAQAPKEPVERVAGANATLVNTQKLVFTGLQLSFGSYLVDAQEAFQRLEKSAAALDVTETPVQVNGFSLDPAAASALRKENSLAPGVFTVETVEGLSSIDATGGIEAVLAATGPRAKSAER